MKQPKIGILPLVDQQRRSYWMLPGYMNGLLAAGGIPVMLPYTEDEGILKDFVKTCDGFLFPGGQDVTPSYYNEPRLTDADETCEPLDRMSVALFHSAAAADRPVLGICRGIQLFNVLYGGSLYQDLPTEHPTATEHHQHPPYDVPIHTVEVLPDTFLSGVVGAGTYAVNSIHHQAVKDVGVGLIVQAVSEDGVVESVSDPNRAFLLGVQWHPECAFEKDPKSLAVFEAFVRACAPLP